MRRAENEAEPEENQDQSDSSEHGSPSLSVQANTSAAVEEPVEASLQDVANLRLSPSPANDTTEQHASKVVNDVLRSASHEVEENVSVSDHTTHCKPVDRGATLSDRTSTKSDSLAVSSDKDSVVDSSPDHPSRSNLDSEADSRPSNTLHSKPESGITNSGCTSTSIVVDGAGSNELDSSLGPDVNSRMQSQCGQVAVGVEDKSETVTAEESPASHS